MIPGVQQNPNPMGTGSIHFAPTLNYSPTSPEKSYDQVMRERINTFFYGVYAFIVLMICVFFPLSHHSLVSLVINRLITLLFVAYFSHEKNRNFNLVTIQKKVRIKDRD